MSAASWRSDPTRRRPFIHDRRDLSAGHARKGLLSCRVELGALRFCSPWVRSSSHRRRTRSAGTTWRTTSKVAISSCGRRQKAGESSTSTLGTRKSSCCIAATICSRSVRANRFASSMRIRRTTTSSWNSRAAGSAGGASTSTARLPPRTTSSAGSTKSSRWRRRRPISAGTSATGGVGRFTFGAPTTCRPCRTAICFRPKTTR